MVRIDIAVVAVETAKHDSVLITKASKPWRDLLHCSYAWPPTVLPLLAKQPVLSSSPLFVP